MKICSLCRVSKPPSDFRPPTASSKYPSRYCIPCARKKSLEYIKAYVSPPAYNIWVNMKRRCYLKYKGYGERGITYDPDWETYEGFWEDMGSTYVKGLTLERNDVNGNYCKENCRWATWLEQANNRRNTRWLTLNGVTKSLPEWCRELGLNKGTVYSRLYHGHSPEDLLKPALKRRN